MKRLKVNIQWFALGLAAQAYPDKGQGRDFPFKNVVNARPETIKASKPRLDSKKLPFDPREAIMQVPKRDNLDRG